MYKKFWKEIIKLRCEQACNITLINAEVQTMIDSTKVQKNVNMTIEDGLKKINDFVALISKDHSSARKKQEDYQRYLAFPEKNDNHKLSYGIVTRKLFKPPELLDVPRTEWVPGPTPEEGKNNQWAARRDTPLY